MKLPISIFSAARQKPRRKTIVMHVGLGKTGTTAIQNFFWLNREKLGAYGLLYPSFGIVAGAHHLLSPFIPEFLQEAGFQQVKPEEWLDKLKGVSEERILLSSELIGWTPQETAREFCQLARQSFDLKVCVYLRRQDTMISSSYNQSVKKGNQRLPLEQVLEGHIAKFDYLKLLLPWEEGVGAENMIVLPYEKGQLKNGSIIDDFCEKVLGIERLDGLDTRTERDPNPSLCRGALECRLHLNALASDPAKTAVFDEALGRFSEAWRKENGVKGGEENLLTHAQRQDILNRATATNEYIARKFLGRADGKLFLDPLRAPDEGAGNEGAGPEMPEASMVEILSYMHDNFPEAHETAMRMIEEGRASPRPELREAAQTLS